MKDGLLRGADSKRDTRVIAKNIAYAFQLARVKRR
jgi:hypothetical protein